MKIFYVLCILAPRLLRNEIMRIYRSKQISVEHGRRERRFFFSAYVEECEKLITSN